MDQSKLKRFLFWVLILGSLVGCKKGCSYRNEIDSEQKKVTAAGREFVLEAKMYEHGNTRRSSNSYSVEIGLIGPDGRLRGEHPIYGIDYNADLEAILEPAKIIASKNHFTLQLVYLDQVCAMFHLLDGRIIDSPYPLTKEDQLSSLDINRPTTKQLDIEVYPDKAGFIRELVNDKSLSWAINPKDARYVAVALEKTALSTNDLVALFERWPNDPLAKAYFHPEKIKALRESNPDWYALAQARILREYQTTIEDAKLHHLVFVDLADPKIARKLDSLYLTTELRDELDWTNKEYLFRRLDDPMPLEPALKAKVEELAASGINDYYVEWPERPGSDLDVAVEYYAWSNNQKMIDRAVEILLKWPRDESNQKQSGSEVSAYIRNANKCFKHLGKDRGKVARFYFDNISLADESNQEDILEMCDGHIPCDELMPVVMKYNEERWGQLRSAYFIPLSCKKGK